MRPTFPPYVMRKSHASSAAAPDLLGIGDRRSGGNCKQKLVFANSADERPPLLHAGRKTTRDFRRNGALRIQLKPHPVIDAAEVLQRVEKPAARIRGKKRRTRHGRAKLRLGDRVTKKHSRVRRTEKTRRIQIEICALRRNAANGRFAFRENSRRPAPFLRRAYITADDLCAIVRHDMLDALRDTLVEPFVVRVV